MFIDYTGPMPSAAEPGKPSDVWNAAALTHVQTVYLPYRRGGHADLASLATADLIYAMKLGRAPPVDPLCDCARVGRVSINSEVLEAKPPLSAKVLVSLTNEGRNSNIYLYLAQTPLGFKIDDIATPTMRQGVLAYLRSNRKTDVELEADRVAAIERGECPPLDNGC